MAYGARRFIWHTIRVGDKDVEIKEVDEYADDNLGVPVRVTILGPNELRTEGTPREAWKQMMELLGVAPPASPTSDVPQAAENSECKSLQVPPCEFAATVAAAASPPPCEEVVTSVCSRQVVARAIKVEDVATTASPKQAIGEIEQSEKDERRNRG